MKASGFWTLAFVTGFLLVAVVWQSGRYQELSSRARELERLQETWISENRKLESGISILSSRTRTGQMVPSLGLQKAAPEDRMRVLVSPSEASGG